MSNHTISAPETGIIQQIRDAIRAELPCTALDVQSGSPRHFTIRVVSPAFAALPRVRQQQLVYASIKDLMAGEDAPVHAIDRLDCIIP